MTIYRNGKQITKTEARRLVSRIGGLDPADGRGILRRALRGEAEAWDELADLASIEIFH